MKASTAKKLACAYDDKQHGSITSVIGYIKTMAVLGYCNANPRVKKGLEDKISQALRKNGFRVFTNSDGTSSYLEIEW
jgi:hypothetical protein